MWLTSNENTVSSNRYVGSASDDTTKDMLPC